MFKIIRVCSILGDHGEVMWVCEQNGERTLRTTREVVALTRAVSR